MDEVLWVETTQTSQWQSKRTVAEPLTPAHKWDVEVQLEQPLQTIDGFGACFNELGWISLCELQEEDQQAILHDLFAPGAGANFTICRTPIGANDFSRDWYSYDETPDDLGLKNFNIANDLDTLVPFIKDALQYQPKLKIWASPWSPPTWMKYNRHYAGELSEPDMPPNGLKPEQQVEEGTDQFIQEERYFRSYAAYFSRFVQEYARWGIKIDMVMPQNEFNSPQPFPSCSWTSEGLAKFIAFLGPEMERFNVDVFFGTMERPNEKLVDVALLDPEAGKYIKGAGFQWAGRRAIVGIHRRYPDLKLHQTEQECGDGKNDWRYCRYAWTLSKRFFENGVSAYQYWNIALNKDARSRWGWAQNSLVTIDPAARTYQYNYEYYLLKHFSHFVNPGARRLDTFTLTGHDNLLAFVNPDRTVVILMQNDLCQELPVRVKVAGKVIGAVLKADSFNTLVVQP